MVVGFNQLTAEERWDIVAGVHIQDNSRTNHSSLTPFLEDFCCLSLSAVRNFLSCHVFSISRVQKSEGLILISAASVQVRQDQSFVPTAMRKYVAIRVWKRFAT